MSERNRASDLAGSAAMHLLCHYYLVLVRAARGVRDRVFLALDGQDGGGVIR